MIYYVGTHSEGNAGDVVIGYAVRKLLSELDKDIRLVRDYAQQPHFDGPVIVAGGGLLIADSRPNSTSGWRWNISATALKAIEYPVVVFGIGFNKFRGQDEFTPVFAEHLRTLVDKSVFFSLREKAGIKRLEPYIGDLVEEVRWQPCPASFLGCLYPKPASEGYTVFAPAMDRLSLRGDIKRIVPVLKSIPNLKIALHIKGDREFLDYFKGDVVDLGGKPANEIIQFYAKAKQVIGMRLHSILIPFGFGVPVIPLISHNKLSDWLVDIGHSEWGVELAQAEQVADHLNAPQLDIAMRDHLYDVTCENLMNIEELIA